MKAQKIKQYLLTGAITVVSVVSVFQSVQVFAQSDSKVKITSQKSEGSDVGKGGVDGKRKVIGHGNYKSGVRDSDDLLGYCDEALGILMRAKRIASEEFADGDLSGSRQTLVQGLVEAAASFNGVDSDNSPLTKLAVERGLSLNTAFKNGCNDNSSQCLDLEARVAVFFMGKYYDYVLNVVRNLDEQYYIPYVTRYHHCRMHSCLPEDFGSDFFVAYRDSAKALLEFYSGQNPVSGLPDAFAKDKYELRIAELVLNWAAQDLNSDLYRRNFACLIKEIGLSADDIARYNTGDTQRFKTSRRAVLFARSVTNQVVEELSLRNSCVIYPVWR